MPWCPKCKSEYREGFSRCATCGVELVDTFEEVRQYETAQASEPVYEIQDYRTVKGVIATLEGYGIPFRIEVGTVYVTPSQVKKAKRLLEGEDAGEEAASPEGDIPGYEGDGQIVMGIAKREKDIPKITEALEQAGIPYTVDGKGIFVDSEHLEEALDATEPLSEMLESEAGANEEYAETDSLFYSYDNILEKIFPRGPKEDEWEGDGIQVEITQQPEKQNASDTPEAFQADNKPSKDDHEMGEERKKKRGLFRRKDEQDW